MRGDHVIPLGESLHAHLPVSGDLLHRMKSLITIFHIEVTAEMLNQFVSNFFKWHRLRIKVDENKSTPNGH